MKSELKKLDLIAKVINLRLVDNWSTRRILDYLTNELKYSKTQSYEYLKWARQEMKDRYQQTNDAMIEEAIFQYEEMIEKAKESGDIKIWNDLRKELNKILGLYAVEKIDLTTGGDKINEIKLIQVIKDIKKDDLNNEKS